MIRRDVKRLLRDEGGYATIWLVAGITTILGMAAIAVDTGYLYAEENRLQATADSAVLAASYELMNGGTDDAVKAAATEFARKNMPQAQYGDVLQNADVEFGQWDAGNGFTVSSSSAADAIRITLRRTAANGNAVDTFFAQILNNDEVDMVVQAVAALGSPGCNGGTMFMAGNQVTLGQDVRLNAGSCVYGRNGVSAGQDPVVEEGAYIAALDKDDITFGQNPSIPDGAIGEADIQPSLANDMNQILSDLQSGVNLPPQITSVEVVSKLPKNNQITAGTAYVITGNVSIGQDYVLTDVIIAATGNISFGQDGSIRNSAGDCAGGGGTAVGLFAGNNISLGQDAEVTGAQLVAGKNIDIGQDLRGLAATIEAGNNLSIGQDPELSACEGAIASGGGGSSVASRLVR